MSELSSLEDSINALIDGASIMPQDIASELSTLTEVWWPKQKLVIKERLSLAKTPTRLTWLFKVVLPGDVEATVDFEAELAADVITYDIDLQLSADFSLEKIYEELGTGFFAGPLAFFKDFEIKSVQWHTLNVDTTRLTLRLDKEIALEFGPIQLALDGESLQLDFDEDKLEGRIFFSLRIGGQTIGAQCELRHKLEFNADIDEFDFDALLEELDLSLPSLNSLIPLDKLPKGRFKLDFNHPENGISYTTRLGDLGHISLALFDSNSQWIFVAGIDFKDDFRFRDLDPALKPLEFIEDCVEFGRPSLYYASDGISDYTWPTSSQNIDLLPGFYLNADLSLHKHGLEFVEKLTGLDSLPILSPIAPSQFINFTLVAHIRESLKVIPGMLTLEDFSISASGNPLSISATGRTQIVIFGSELPQMLLGVKLDEAGTGFTFRTDEPWTNPLGLPVSITDLVFEIKMPESAYAFLGAIDISGQSMIVTGQFLGQTPVMLAGTLDGEFSMGMLMKTFTGLELIPDAIDLKYRDFTMRMVANPLGVTIGDEFFPPGLSFKGTLAIMGLELFTQVTVDIDEGAAAEGRLNKAIDLPPILRITGPNGQGAPYLKLNTKRDPILELGGEFTFLGIKDTVEIEINGDEVTYHSQKKLGPVSTNLECRLGDGHFAATGDFEAMVRGSVGPIRPIPQGPSLGSYRIDTGCKGSIEIAVDEDGDHSVKIEGRLSVAGATISLPQIDIKGKIKQFQDLPKIILELIKERAVELLEELFATAEQWLKNIADGLIKITEEDIGRTLSEYYHKSKEEIGKLANSVLKLDAEGVFRTLKGAGVVAEDAAKILIELGHPADQVEKVFKALFPGSHIDQSFGHLDTPAKGHIDKAASAHINKSAKGHVDVGAKAHIDKPGKGHVNVGGKGHVDKRIKFGIGSKHINTAAVPHLDEKAIPHVNIGAKPHIDTPAVPHVNIPAELHVDTKAIPHGDVGKHVDTN